ncbi:bifunctional diaminohydroxyphosphoribosylaminopyrimidine deaminase/5-amino-6-(5-phosphoribosylamino)uracil reductase RibD [Dehalobacterium formicoaceticum]|uniref:Riboflavin biosynthesis protein RibD n=2 Tax=Dehalobacterium formicoaceticum TaxID=51515 RepID=A0ABT1Y1A7_9FIRM|nr:bifunctional diaminohydroxyphosphoribosylaminopyrimidine deaminase/5-amino-6-(5-phosphoribosylamino)uracil reductase RibD [Dehalobacterium formicoaceticum]
MKVTDEQWMQRAINLARKGEGWTSPNPMVGAVIVREGQVVGEGYHQKAGTPHAEIHALQMAGTKALGGTMYVTLEPCCHHGRTPPCTDALIKAGLKKVVVAMVDPNPQVAGGGIAKLRAAGMEVVTGVLEDEARVLNEVFIKQITSQRPFIAFKSAVTLDGKTSSYTGSSKWITGEEARMVGRQLRHRYDAILTGIGTVLADDPLLTTRVPGLKDPQRVILDSRLRIPMEAQVLDTKSAPTLVFTGEIADGEPKAALLAEKGVEVISCPGSEGQVDIFSVLKILSEKGITSILIEGGAQIQGAFFDRELVDKLYVFIAPKLIGGHHAPGMLGGMGIAEMGHAVRVYDLKMDQIGTDFLLTGYPEFGG